MLWEWSQARQHWAGAAAPPISRPTFPFLNSCILHVVKASCAAWTFFNMKRHDGWCRKKLQGSCIGLVDVVMPARRGGW